MTDSQPWGLAVDASGDVWFVEMAGNQIGRFDPQAETFVEYAVPTPASERGRGRRRQWNHLVHGEAGNKIGKLVPGTGAITEYNVPTANSQPSGLAIYGGIAFFAEAQGNRLGRVTLGVARSSKHC